MRSIMLILVCVLLFVLCSSFRPAPAVRRTASSGACIAMLSPSPLGGAEKDGIAKATVALGALGLGAVLSAREASAATEAVTKVSKVVKEPLSYSFDALEPHIDAQTMQIHYDRHYGTYVAKTNSLIAGTKLAQESLTSIMDAAWAKKDSVLYNNAAQVYNHALYWNSMTPQGGGGAPSAASAPKIARAIDAAFSDYGGFRKAFASAGNTAFGSGWAWLVYNKKSKGVEIVQTIGADNPINKMGGDVVPLLTMDVWEHAYYLKYMNQRAAYVDAWLDHLVDWQSAEARLSKLEKGLA